MRHDGRGLEQLREIKVELDYLEFPMSSCLITFGKTQVLCAVSVENRVPQFLLGKGQGWLTAEYSLLPASTQKRTQRESLTGRPSGRTQEVSRFVGRSLRPIFDLNLVGERTFIIDCDVLQADGGTRTTAVNGAFIALYRAVEKMMENKEFSTFPILDHIGAISAGVVKGKLMLDLAYEEDSTAEVDMNLVMTGRGKIIEVQATAEKLPVTRTEFDKLVELGSKGIKEIIEIEKKLLGKSV